MDRMHGFVACLWPGQTDKGTDPVLRVAVGRRTLPRRRPMAQDDLLTRALRLRSPAYRVLATSSLPVCRSRAEEVFGAREKFWRAPRVSVLELLSASLSLEHWLVVAD